MLHGKYDEAKRSLARLRLRNLGDEGEEGQGDLLVQLELLEMRVETTLIRRSLQRELQEGQDDDVADADPAKGSLKAEWKTWKRLFSYRYRDRTWIGVLIMVFQR